METRDKGFQGNQVMRIQATQNTRDKNFETTRETLMQIPGVQDVSKTTTVPGDMVADTSTQQFKSDNEKHRLVSVKVSTTYFNTLGIRLVSGRLFDERYADQHTRSVILNETAASKIVNPIGKTIFFDNCDTVPVRVIGIVKDFLVQSLEHKIQPVAYTIGNNACMFQSGGGLLVKIDGPSKASTIAAIEQSWKSIEPDFPIRYSFLDENFQRLFGSYIRLQKVISIFTLTAIIISAIGLFAMTANIASQRRKEIGVRKVLGASVMDIAGMLSKDFVILILISIAIAAPIGFWITGEWLSTFSYRINLSWWLFGIAALSVFAVAFVTICVQTVKAARVNPIGSLRSE
jgi:putative ABC transport system permease protein